MTIAEALHKTKIIRIQSNPLPVEETSASEIQHIFKLEIKLHYFNFKQSGVYKMAVAGNADFLIEQIQESVPDKKHSGHVSTYTYG